MTVFQSSVADRKCLSTAVKNDHILRQILGSALLPSNMAQGHLLQLHIILDRTDYNLCFRFK